MTRSQLQYALDALLSLRKIKKVERGKYLLVQKGEKIAMQVSPLDKREKIVTQISPLGEKEKMQKLEIQPKKEGDSKKLKDLYQKQPYKQVMDYLFRKSEIDVAQARRKLWMQEKEFVEVVNQSLNCQFIEEMRVLGYSFRYSVKNVAKVWYNLLQKEQTMEDLYMRIGLLNKRQLEEAIDEGIQMGAIAEVKFGVFLAI